MVDSSLALMLHRVHALAGSPAHKELPDAGLLQEQAATRARTAACRSCSKLSVSVSRIAVPMTPSFPTWSPRISASTFAGAENKRRPRTSRVAGARGFHGRAVPRSLLGFADLLQFFTATFANWSNFRSTVPTPANDRRTSKARAAISAARRRSHGGPVRLGGPSTGLIMIRRDEAAIIRPTHQINVVLLDSLGLGRDLKFTRGGERVIGFCVERWRCRRFCRRSGSGIHDDSSLGIPAGPMPAFHLCRRVHAKNDRH